jgi:hypothetical protein
MISRAFYLPKGLARLMRSATIASGEHHLKDAIYYALDIVCAAACYYFAGWQGIIAFAAVWVAGVAAFAWFASMRRRYRTSFSKIVLWGEMADVLAAVGDFTMARHNEVISELPDDTLALATAYYGSLREKDRYSRPMQDVGDANHALALDEVQRRGIDAKLKNAAVVVATARMDADERTKGFVFAITSLKILAAVAIVCVLGLMR